MTTSRELLSLAAAALKGATAVGDQVYTAPTWPTWSGVYPYLYLRPPLEHKEALSRNGPPQFNVLTTLRIQAKAELPAQPNGLSAAALEDQLAIIGDQVQAALVNNPPIQKLLQQVAFIRTSIETNSNGDVELGVLEIEVGLEHFQGPEAFYDLPVYPITEIQVVNDLGNVFDPTGNYAGSEFPDAVTAVPRTSGPDGRAEGGLIIELSES